MSISQILQDLKNELEPYQATLVAVSKTYGPERVKEATDAGQLDLGENKVQEMCEKQEVLDKNIRWHQIGHLQSNKVKYLAPFVHLIHSVDSLKLLEEINKQAIKNNRVIPCLLQMHIASEETKFGMNKEEVEQILQTEILTQLDGIELHGLMGMATNTEDTTLIRREFKELKMYYDELKKTDHPSIKFNTLSMGMSSDYKLALDEGSTMVRIGSRIFGKR